MRIVTAALLTLALTGCVESHDESTDWWIVFSSNRTGNGDLYAIHPESLELLQITSSDVAEGAPRIDAVRNRIVHHRYEGDPEIARLYVGSTWLMDDPHGEIPPVWSAQGSDLTYVARSDSGYALVRAQADGSGSQPIFQSDVELKYPVVSSAGALTYFLRRTEAGWGIVELDERHAAFRTLIEIAGYAGHLALSSDDSSLAFDTRYEGDAEIAILDIETGQVRRVTRRAGNDLVPSFSPDGRFVIHAGDQDGNWDVWMTEITTGAQKRLTTDPSFDGGPVVVPDSTIRAALGAQ